MHRTFHEMKYVKQTGSEQLLHARCQARAWGTKVVPMPALSVSMQISEGQRR